MDQCSIKAIGGKGGDGALSFSSIWCRQWNGPDGGEGGNGGHVIFEGKYPEFLNFYLVCG